MKQKVRLVLLILAAKYTSIFFFEIFAQAIEQNNLSYSNKLHYFVEDNYLST